MTVQFTTLVILCLIHLTAASIAKAQTQEKIQAPIQKQAEESFANKEIEILFEDAAEPWSKSDGTGYANDIVIAAFQKVGVQVRKSIVPYSRCKQMVLGGKSVACVSMTWLPEFKGKIELADVPLIVLNADVFENTKKPLPRPASGKCALPKDTAVAVVQAYEYPAATTALEKQGVKWLYSRTDQQSLQRLALNRVDAAIVITNDLQPRNAKAIKAGVADKVVYAFSCGEETGTIGFSLKHPDGSLIRKLYQEGYRRLKTEGGLDEIHRKWAQPVAVSK